MILVEYEQKSSIGGESSFLLERTDFNLDLQHGEHFPLRKS